MIVGSLAPLFGEHSMEAWLHLLLDERQCMDCKTAIEGLEGGMVFRGQLPLTDLAGHLCTPYWEWREVLRQGSHAQQDET